MALPPIFIFGLSGVGKTTLVENICKKRSFYLPRQVVTRLPRRDDNFKKFQYISREVFLQLSSQKAFIIEDDDGINCYGYKKSSLKRSSVTLMYGLPSQIDVIRRMGGICILIQGDASRGLQMRGDNRELIERREKINQYLQWHYYRNLDFLQNMDLILTNEFGTPGKIIMLFQQFVAFKKEELKAQNDTISSLCFVLEIYRNPLVGMKITHERHLFWVKKAFQNDLLQFLFYSKIIYDNRITV